MSSKSYPNKQSYADHSNCVGYQLTTRKRGNLSNFLDFKQVYSLYKFTEKHWKNLHKTKNDYHTFCKLATD